MRFYQKEIELQFYKRGFHLITDHILSSIPEINQINIGQLQIFIKHTSDSLTINKNTDHTQLEKILKSHLNKMIPEAPYYRHTYEGD